jgi:hypothetical protein
MTLLPEIQAVSDLNTLSAVLRASMSAKSLDEVKQLLR